MNIKKSTLNNILKFSLAFFAILIVLLVSGGGGPQSNSAQVASTSAVTIEGEKQIINISVRGGYNPNKIDAKANIATVIRMTTKNSFDCSTALVIPKLSFRQNLPTTGVTDIPVTAQTAGSKINGTCSMGMYNFQINFN
jgi:plastocyanin domain-containing protein